MVLNYKKHSLKLKERKDYVDSAELARLQAELSELRRQNGVDEKRSPLFRRIDSLLEQGESRLVDRNRYIRLAVSCGWFTGLHRFYAGQKVTGMCYLLFFWTGIPFAMTLLDLMAVLPKQADQSGRIMV